MNPYQNALKKKKFEGLKIEISPMDPEQEKQDAAMGDGAPEVKDDFEKMGEMEKPMTIGDDEAMEFAQNAKKTPGPEDMTSEEVFGAAPPEGSPQSLRDRVMQRMKRKK